MQIGMGILGWSPDQFWSSSNPELIAAIEGWREMQGEKPRFGETDRNRLRALMDAYPDRLPSIKREGRPLDLGDIKALEARIRH